MAGKSDRGNITPKTMKNPMQELWQSGNPANLALPENKIKGIDNKVKTTKGYKPLKQNNLPRKA